MTLETNGLDLKDIYPIAEGYGEAEIIENISLKCLYITKDYECKKWVKVYIEDPNDNIRTFKHFELVNAGKPLQHYLKEGYGKTNAHQIRDNIPLAIAILEGDVVEKFEDIEVIIGNNLFRTKGKYTVTPIAKHENTKGEKIFLFRIQFPDFGHLLYGRAKETYRSSNRYTCMDLCRHSPENHRNAAFINNFATPQMSVEYVKTFIWE